MSDISHYTQRGNFDDAIDHLESLLEQEVQKEEGYGSIIVVENLPVVGPEKLDKLNKVITKIFSQVGTLRDDGLTMPLDEKEKQTMGFALVEFKTPSQAKQAVQLINGYKLDKAHIFNVSLYDDILKLKKVSETYTLPVVKEYQERENLREWLMDERGLSQYIIRYGDESEVYWNEIGPNQKPEMVMSKKKMTEHPPSTIGAAWSPQGSYLPTFHAQGVILCGGNTFNKMMRFAHPGVKAIDFSPCEKYIVTFSPQFQDNDNAKDPQCILVWEVRSGKKLKGFPGSYLHSTSGMLSWPCFHWSYDDQYMAVLRTPESEKESEIWIYKSPSMEVLDKQPLKIPGVKDFCWSPKQLFISCWVPEHENQAARVILLEVPTRKEKRQQNMFNVNDCKMYWQDQGEYLCVKVECHTKTKKSTYTNFEIFRIKEKDIPVEVLPVKENVYSFAWEPRGSRFAIVHGENAARPDISFYEVKGKKIELLKKIEKKAVTQLYWSPQGQFVVLANLKNFNGTLEFFNVNEMETMSTQDTMATELEWDPTGRFLATSVTRDRATVENGYTIWSFQGQLLFQKPRDRFWHFHFRPLPPSLLTPERLKEIKKNLRTFTEKYNKADSEKRDRWKAELIAKRKKMRDEFYEMMAQCAAPWVQNKERRERLLGYPEETDADFVYYTEQVEIVLDEVEEICP